MRHFFLLLIVCILCVLVFPACKSRQSDDEPAASSPIGAPSDATVDEVCKITSELMGVDPSQVKSTTSLEDLGCDELDFVELVMEIEERFDISIPDDTAEQMLESDDWKLGMKNVTMQKLADIVRARKN